MNTLALKSKCVIFFFFLFVSYTEASSVAEKFPKGSGSKFVFSLFDGNKADLVISIADSSEKRIAVEYYISMTSGFIPVKLWQQYVMETPSSGTIQVVEGYVQSPDINPPEKLTKEYLQGVGEIQVTDFLFSRKGEIERLKVADEIVVLPAGRTKATHYRKKGNGQTVDFWISDDARPIGLVKLISKSDKKEDQNYSITLMTLVKNLQATIDPRQAVPLTDKGKSLLASPTAKH